MAFTNLTATATTFQDGISTLGIESAVDAQLAGVLDKSIVGVDIIAKDKARRQGKELDVQISYDAGGGGSPIVLVTPFHLVTFIGTTLQEASDLAAAARAANPGYFWAVPFIKYINEFASANKPFIVFQFYNTNPLASANWDVNNPSGTSTTVPAGPDRSVQFNDAGAFGGVGGAFEWIGTSGITGRGLKINLSNYPLNPVFGSGYDLFVSGLVQMGSGFMAARPCQFTDVLETKASQINTDGTKTTVSFGNYGSWILTPVFRWNTTTLTVLPNTPSTSPTTGALVVTGGVGADSLSVDKDLYLNPTGISGKFLYYGNATEKNSGINAGGQTKIPVDKDNAALVNINYPLPGSNQYARISSKMSDAGPGNNLVGIFSHTVQTNATPGNLAGVFFSELLRNDPDRPSIGSYHHGYITTGGGAPVGGYSCGVFARGTRGNIAYGIRAVATLGENGSYAGRFEGNLWNEAADFHYFGDPTTDGTWRFGRSGNDWVFQRRESSSWVTKQTITP